MIKKHILMISIGFIIIKAATIKYARDAQSETLVNLPEFGLA